MHLEAKVLWSIIPNQAIPEAGRNRNSLANMALLDSSHYQVCYNQEMLVSLRNVGDASQTLTLLELSRQLSNTAETYSPFVGLLESAGHNP
jgi:hypothetical protein